MDVSLRSSTIKGNECKLRRPETAVHETTQRFVESLGNDVRISQYSDLAFAARNLSQGYWYWLDPVPGGRVGYLVFTPQNIVWIDDQFKRSYKIQIRVNAAMCQKTSVMIASLNKSDGLLRIEDAWYMEGESLMKSPFTQRWNSVLAFYTNKFRPDSRLQQGLRVELANFQSLHSASTWKETPTMMFAQGGTRRFRVQFIERKTREEEDAERVEQKVRIAETVVGMRKPAAAAAAAPVATPVAAAKPKKKGTFAIPSDEFPDTYTIMIDGVKKGFAAVQDLELSLKLRKAETKEIPVKVEWSSEFNMYEILDTC